MPWRDRSTGRKEPEHGGLVSVGIVMGSSSDSEIMDGAVQALSEFDVETEVRVLSAHRTPDDTLAYARSAAGNGKKVLIAGAGGAAHLAGVLAAATPLPVIGVPIALANLGGLDSLLSMVQMPRGVPVATVAVKVLVTRGSSRSAYSHSPTNAWRLASNRSE